MDTDAEREARRAYRGATMRVRKTTLHDRAGEDGLWGPTTAAERLELLGQLSDTGWLLSGRPVPGYDRSDMPVRIARRPPVRLG